MHVSSEHKANRAHQLTGWLSPPQQLHCLLSSLGRRLSHSFTVRHQTLRQTCSLLGELQIIAAVCSVCVCVCVCVCWRSAKVRGKLMRSVAYVWIHTNDT